MATPNVNDPQIKKDIEENKLIAAIGYVGLLFLIPMFLKPKSQYAKFHSKNGLILFVASLINLALNLLPILGQILFVIGGIAILLLSIIGILKSLSGEYWEMPYLSEYVKKINI